MALAAAQLLILEEAVRRYQQDHAQEPSPLASLLALPRTQQLQTLLPYVQAIQQEHQKFLQNLPQSRATQDAALQQRTTDLTAVLTALTAGTL
jgi:hypothetical protein